MAPRRSSRETGVALIEFAFILPFLFVLTFVVIDLSRAFYLKSMITAAAREGARVAAVTPDPSGVGRDSVVARVGKVLQPTGMATDSIRVTLSGTTGNQTATVKVATHFNWIYMGLFNYVGASAITNPQSLSASSVMRFE